MSTASATPQVPAGAIGTVYLVGAGPGDPGLITVRGANLLALADVVVYDALVNPLLLSHCNRFSPVEKIYVGKRAAAHSMSQEQINQVLIDQAKTGKTVVRLKGGDPFVFGRGGEECLALKAAGVQFEVVPGITAAIAAPAYAGIPVTHRDFNSSFTFLTGHEKEEQYQDDQARARAAGTGSDIDWPAMARLPCLAFYMGVKSLGRICSKLIEHGMDPATPAAIIERGSTPRQRTITGTLNNLPDKAAAAKVIAPAMTIIGQVVSLRDQISWFENRPLFGKTVVVTRAREQASELTAKLLHLGARVIEAPAIEMVPGPDQARIESTLRSLAHQPFDWIIFTSANGVRFTRQKLFDLGLDARALGPARFAVVGESTAAALADLLGIKADLCPTEFVADALATALADRREIAGKRFLLLRADIARPMLQQRLTTENAAAVVDLAIYETRTINEIPADLETALVEGTVDWITFTSSSTVKQFIELVKERFPKTAKLASIGPVTTQAMAPLQLQPTVQAQTANVTSLVEAITLAERR